MKKVIFVGGTSYSGSTFFDMTLANDPAGFSCGEVYAIFYPFRKHHIQFEKFGNDIDWKKIKEDGPSNLYNNLFKRFPDIEYIIDSSKHPVWISERTNELTQSGIDVKHVLIWKTPAEFYHSRFKRGRGIRWKREWLGYHRHYMGLVQNWRAVRYSDFAQNKGSLIKLCEILGIDYFEGKEQYWNKKHHTLFGNWSAKIHLHDKGSKPQGNLGELGENIPSQSTNAQHLDDVHKHRKIY